MFLSTDKKFPKSIPSPKGLTVEKSRTVIFVRHAESAWNEVFNKGFGADFPGRLSSALNKEGKLFATMDSVFVDSPLSEYGAKQAIDLKNYIENELTDEVIGGSSLIASSNLRRALSTGTIGFWKRLGETKEKIKILSSLQEVTFNMDGMSIAKPKSAPQLSDDELDAIEMDKKSFIAEEYYECSENYGNKPIKSNGHRRLQDFAAWCFDEEQQKYDTIIACGHSLYFRFFFQHFLDSDGSHVAKKSKVANCGVVKFQLEKGTTEAGETWFRIPENSLEELYVGFESKKITKKKN